MDVTEAKRIHRAGGMSNHQLAMIKFLAKHGRREWPAWLDPDPKLRPK